MTSLPAAVLGLSLAGLIPLCGAAQAETECPLATGVFDPEAAASNLITTCKVLEALDLVESGRIVRLGRVYEAGMPFRPDRVFDLRQKMPSEVPVGQEDDPRPTTAAVSGPNRVVGNVELLLTEIGQIGTQLDGVAHVGRARSSDPRSATYYLGLPAEEVNATPANPEGGLRRLGIEHVKPILTRGILVDLAPFGASDCAGRPCLGAGDEITLADVGAALAAQGLNLDDVTRGDAIFFNTGWSNLWGADQQRFNAGEPGIGLEVAGWLGARDVVVVGADNWGIEVAPRRDSLRSPVHQRLLVDEGIFLHENMVFDGLVAAGIYEFAYLFVPLPVKGATGSPGTPVALY